MTKEEQANNTEKPKAEVYSWKIIDQPGEFKMIHKSMLNVDHDYQRHNVTNARVLDIARCWSWAALGVLLVAMRKDGTYWVFDGQHRKLAADKRADIQSLPCMVFPCGERVDEAKNFLLSNTNRGPVKTMEKFNALVMASDKYAVDAKEMVENSGYKISNTNATFTVQCVGAIMNGLKTDRLVTHRAWNMCVELFNGEKILDEVMQGMYSLELHLSRLGLGSIHDKANREALKRHGVKALMLSIQEAKAYNGGGSKACGEGILRLLNKHRSSRRIPSLYSNGDE